MSYLINNQQKVNEIIFANRNKSYGAYAIRSDYGSTLLKSLSIMILGFGLFMSLAFYYSNRNNNNNNAPKESILTPTQDTVTVFTMPPEPDPEPEPPTNTEPSSGGSTSQTIGTEIVDTTSVDTHSALNTDFNPNAVTTNTPGTGTEGTVPVTSTATSTGSTSTEPKGLPFVDSQPEFEGGLNALRKFVAERIHYPSLAIDEGKGGTVYVKFVVDEKGKVSSLSLLNNLGYGLDQEALRVVGLIPNFVKPAMVGGQPVKVYYQLPIKFTVAK